MTEDELFGAGFSRGSRGRSSLPLHHSSPKRERAPGVLYLQLGEETKQVQVRSDLLHVDALRALFVRAFPQQLSLRLLQAPHASICIRDQNQQSYRPLEDIRSISPQCCLKVHVGDPGLELRSGPSSSAEPRISKELLYGSSALQNQQGSTSPPVVRPMPPSPSPSRGQGSSTLPRRRPQGAGHRLGTNSSAILERRDVLPDEELCPAVAFHPDALPRAPVSLPPSLPSVRGSGCSAPPSLCVELQGPGAGLPRFHASVKPLHGHTGAPQSTSPLRPKLHQRFGDPVGPLSPPGSPQRRSTAGRASPLPPELNGLPHEAYRGRSAGSNSSSSPVFVDQPLALMDDVFRSLGPLGAQCERISAMEEQIASLAGLVHRALSVGAETPEVHHLPGENGPQPLLHLRPVMSHAPPGHAPPGPAPPGHAPPGSAPQCHAPPGPAPPRRFPGDGLQHQLSLTKQSVCDLRLQLEQLRHHQLHQQAVVHSMLRAMGQELLSFMRQKLLHSHENLYGPRVEVERGRREYVSSQERILHQLSDLEQLVGSLRKSVLSGPGAVSLSDVERAAVNLRKVGQDMALLKGEFPQLQSRMCSVLRLEVEVVRFLKEEPLKMDSMLSRIRSLTEELGSLHRSVSESFVQAKDDQASPRPKPRSSFRIPQNGSDSGEAQTGPASPVTRRSTTSTRKNMSTATEETTRIPPDGSVSPDSNQTKPDPTGTDQDQDQDRPQSSESQLNRSLQDPVPSGESPTQEPPPAPDRDTSPASQNNSSRAIATSPPPQRSVVSSSVTNTKSVEVKEAAGAQVEREKVQVTKPPRQPPEVKPKPQKSAALTGNASINHCPITTTTSTSTNTSTNTTTNTSTAIPDGNKEENNNTAEVKVHANLRASPVQRSCVTQGENHQSQTQLPTENTTVLKPPSDPQTHVKQRISADQQNGRNAASLHQNTVDNKSVSQTDSASLPALQRYAANIVSLEQISEKRNPKGSSTTSDQTLNHFIQDTTSPDHSLRENGSSSPNKLSRRENGNSSGSNVAFDNQGFEDFSMDFSREPFIVVWNEGIDIEAAFNRLSTIFECEEELAKSRESVLNGDDGDAKISAPVQFTFHGESKEDVQVKKPDTKKKFKLKFPKNKLAQISRAIRTGSGKKAKKQDETDVSGGKDNKKTPISSPRPKKQARELCKNALDSIDSLEASIRQLEMSVDSFAVAPSPPPPPTSGSESSERSKRPAPGIQKDSQPPQRKRPKPGRGEQTAPSSPPRSSSDPHSSLSDVGSLSPQTSHRRRSGCHGHSDQAAPPVSP